MEHLFAPWRFAYVSQSSPDTGCIFCAAANGGEETLTVFRGARVFALLNRYPYTSGHAMVAPYEHVGDLSRLDAGTVAELMTVGQRLVEALRRVYHPQGFNLGLNLGEAAGAGIEEHLHLHVVPRWRGDTNFMTVNADVRVIPEDLAATWAKVSREMEADRGR